MNKATETNDGWREMTSEWDYLPEQTPTTTKKTRIVIAGGGFAGLYAAKYLDTHLARRADVEVTLIARENFILFTPMLHEVASGDLAPGDIVNPLRRILRNVNVIEADVQHVDLGTRKIRCSHGVDRTEIEFEFDHLLLALGSETNFFDNAGIRDWAVTMKNLTDATLLRNRMVAFLEEASIERDAAVRRQWLTFVIAGGGFAGAETAGAINDFVRETTKFYRRIGDEEIRVVVIHPGDYLLPELGEELGRYAERKMRERKVEVIKGARVASYDGWVVTLNNGISIPAATLIWTAGVKPSPVVAALSCVKEKGRIVADQYLQVPGFPGLWTAGDCAAVPDTYETGKFFPPTAQHGMREAIVAAKNIERTILGQSLKPFRYRTLGMLASIGHHTGVVSMFGFKFSGFIAWWMWRSVYLMKLPRLVKKLRVMIAWTLDLLFGRDIEQVITLRDIEELSERWARIRATRPASSSPALPETQTASVISQDKVAPKIR
ncbi:MAG TPA: NAD(P)/FAD-dependent oxidoreductase [Chthoniobacterales bacterium]|jgi:NADH dehydrogenase|nr:NAD(P)/FAD-dependent oxidoreductase [Chthoniobacterales bacterium]